MSAPEIMGTVELPSCSLKEPIEVQVRLEDTTMLDAPSVIIAETSCRLGPGSPATARFALFVADEALDARRDYTLSARGDLPGRAGPRRFGTVQSYPWHSRSNRANRLELRRLDQG
jgi:uncharacterized lipoprotein YbaY